MTRLEKASAYAQIVAAIVVPISVVIALLAYLNETDKQRRQYTMELALEFFAGDLQGAKDRLYYTIDEVQRAVAPAALGPSDLRIYLSKTTTTGRGTSRELTSALLAVSGFFNSAERCVRAGLCDEALMRQLIAEDAGAISCVFSGVLDGMARSSNVSGLSSGLNFFDQGDCL